MTLVVNARTVSRPVLVTNVMPSLCPMDRSNGIHVSSCIRRICIRLNHFVPAKDMDKSRMEMGQAWEEGLKCRIYRNWPGRFIDVGEVEHDGMFGTPDLLDMQIPVNWKNVKRMVVEIKCSWMSSGHDPESIIFWKFWVQLMAYCYMLKTRLSKLIIVHVKGDYRDDSPVKYSEWIREFTEWELVTNWAMLKGESRVMDEEARSRGFRNVMDEMEKRWKPADLKGDTT